MVEGNLVLSFSSVIILFLRVVIPTSIRFLMSSSPRKLSKYDSCVHLTVWVNDSVAEAERIGA